MEHHMLWVLNQRERPAWMPLLSTRLLAAVASEALGLGFVDAVARGWLARVAAVFGQPVFEFVEPRRKRSDHLLLGSQLLLLVGKLREQKLDEFDHGIRALLIDRYDVLTRHHEGRILSVSSPPPQPNHCTFRVTKLNSYRK